MVAASSAKKTVKVGLASSFRFRSSCTTNRTSHNVIVEKPHGAAQGGVHVHTNVQYAPQQKQHDQEDLKGFDIVAGKFVNLHPATATMIITVLALLGVIGIVGTCFAMSLFVLIVGILSLVFQEGQVDYFFSAAMGVFCPKRSAGEKLAQAFDLTNPENLKKEQGLLDELWETYDKNGDGDLTLDECTALMKRYIEEKLIILETQRAKAPSKAFAATLGSFQELAKAPEKAARILKNTIDEDRDGKITYEEFMNKFPEALKFAIEGPPKWYDRKLRTILP